MLEGTSGILDDERTEIGYVSSRVLDAGCIMNSGSCGLGPRLHCAGDAAVVVEVAVVSAGVVVGRVEVALLDVAVQLVDAVCCNSTSIGFQCTSKRSLNL